MLIAPVYTLKASLLASPERVKDGIRAQVKDSLLFANFVDENAVKVSQALDIPIGNIRPSLHPHAIEVSRLSHSKDFLRSQASNFEYQIPPGKTIESPGRLISAESLFNHLQELQEEAWLYLYDPSDQEKLEYWLKLDGLSGGDGVINIKAPISLRAVEVALAKIESIIRQCGMDPANFHMPLILELGANSIPGKNVIGNINAQGLIGPDGKLIPLDISIQQTTEDGSYLGNTLPFLDSHLIPSIQQDFQAIANAYFELGYQGVLGGDAIVSLNDKGKTVVEWFDMNSRLNGSSPFQDHYRFVRSICPDAVGINLNLIFPHNVDFEACQKILGKLHFNRDTLGVLVTLLRSSQESQEPVVKASVFGHNHEHLAKILAELRSLNIQY